MKTKSIIRQLFIREEEKVEREGGRETLEGNCTHGHLEVGNSSTRAGLSRGGCMSQGPAGHRWPITMKAIWGGFIYKGNIYTGAGVVEQRRRCSNWGLESVKLWSFLWDRRREGSGYQPLRDRDHVLKASLRGATICNWGTQLVQGNLAGRMP